MGKIRQGIAGFKSFIDEVQSELKKCAWPTKPELLESTIVVIIATILLGVFIGVSDFGLVQALSVIIR